MVISFWLVSFLVRTCLQLILRMAWLLIILISSRLLIILISTWLLIILNRLT